MPQAGAFSGQDHFDFELSFSGQLLLAHRAFDVRCGRGSRRLWRRSCAPPAITSVPMAAVSTSTQASFRTLNSLRSPPFGRSDNKTDPLRPAQTHSPTVSLRRT
jgi:hypothetical protein